MPEHETVVRIAVSRGNVIDGCNGVSNHLKYECVCLGVWVCRVKSIKQTAIPGVAVVSTVAVVDAAVGVG